MSRALTGGPPAPKVPLLAIPSSGSLAASAVTSSGSRKAPPPTRMGSRAAPPISRNNTSPVIVPGAVDIPSDVLDKPIKVSPTSALRLSSDSGAEHGLVDLDAFWLNQSDAVSNNTRSGSLQSVSKGKIRRHATSEVVDLRDMSEDGFHSSRSDGNPQNQASKRSSSVLDLRSSNSMSKGSDQMLRKEFSSLGLESASSGRDLGGLVSNLREVLSLDEYSSEDSDDDELPTSNSVGATPALFQPMLSRSLVEESILSESSTSVQHISTSSSITRSTDTGVSSLSTMASPALLRHSQLGVFAPPAILTSTAVSSAFVNTATFDLPPSIPSSGHVAADDSPRVVQSDANFLLNDGTSHPSTSTLDASLSSQSDSHSTNASRPGAASSAHRASIHLSGLFDRASSLDLHSPHPNPRSFKADYTAFLKTTSEPNGTGEYPAIVDLPIGVEPEPSLAPEPEVVADEPDEEPLFDVAEWQRSSAPEATVTPTHMGLIIPGVSLSANLTLKELKELHGEEIEAHVAPIRPPSPRDRVSSHPPVQRRDRRRVTSSEDSISSGPDEPRRLLEHRRAVARSIAQNSNWDYLKHSTATESSLGSSRASVSSSASRTGSGLIGERGGTDSSRSDTSFGSVPLALSVSGNPPRPTQHRRRRSSTSSLHSSQPEPFHAGANSDYGTPNGNPMARRMSPTSSSAIDLSIPHTTEPGSVPMRTTKRARRRTSPIASAIDLEAPIPNTIVTPTGFFPPTSATLTPSASGSSGSAGPSVVVSSPSTTSAASSNGSAHSAPASFSGAVIQDAQPVFQVEDHLTSPGHSESGWLTAESMMDQAPHSLPLPSTATLGHGVDVLPTPLYSSVTLGSSGGKRRSSNRKKSSRSGNPAHAPPAGSPQHFHHHHHHHHHHHPLDNLHPGIRNSLGEIPTSQSSDSTAPLVDGVSSPLSTFGTSSSAPSAGHALGGLGSTQTSPRFSHPLSAPGQPHHAHASDSDSSVDENYSPFVRMGKRGVPTPVSKSRGGSPPPLGRAAFSRSQPDLDMLSGPPTTSKPLTPAYLAPGAPGTEAWNVEDVMNSLHHFNSASRSRTMFNDSTSSRNDQSRHRRNPSQSRLERRLREIERRLAMLEQYQVMALNQVLPGMSASHGGGPGGFYGSMPPHDGGHHSSSSHHRHRGGSVDHSSLAQSVPVNVNLNAHSSHAGTPSPYNNADGSSSGSGDNKSVGSGPGGHRGGLDSSLVYTASATYSPQYGRKLPSGMTTITSSSSSGPSTSSSTSTDSLHAISAPANLNSSTSFATVAAAQAAAANPYDLGSVSTPTVTITSSSQGDGAINNPYAVPVHESEVTPSSAPSNAPTVSPAAPDLSTTDNAYNRRFQEIMELSGPSKYIQMAALGRDFVSLAEVYGRIIISERCLPAQQKSIKPVALGGQAGGSKFIVQGILFKYALDVKIGEGSKREKWLYGGKRRDDAAAMKAASNELLGLSSFIKCNSTNSIRFPLMALIDYFGYRLVAVSTLPINANTIVYGSADAGKTVHNHDEKIANVMQDFGHDLNLREHMVFNTPIMGPGDLEVHRGSDGFHYMIDFARTFPPEAPGEGAHPQSIFYRLLRPELVRSFPKPLSSDAFSGWQSGDSLSDEMNEDVEEATRKLFESIIPSYPHTSFLTHDFQSLFRSEICNISDVHRRGINLRHLGLLRAEMYKSTEDNDALYLVEMICRTLKTYIGARFRALMDQLVIFAEEPFRNEALQLFNLIAQPSAAPEFWNVRIKTLVQRKYGASALRPEEVDPNVMLLDMLPREHRLYLVRRLAWHLCVYFDENIWDNFEDALNQGAEFQFYPQDIKEIKPRTKYMSILDLALGITLYMQAAGAFDASRNEANILLLEEAKICLVSAWTRVSDCLVTRYFLGKVWHLLGKLRTDGGEDFARALVMIESTMVEERDRPDLRIDFAKAGVMAFIHQREPSRFDRAIVHYREVSRTHPGLARTLIDDIISWLNNQHANRNLDDATFAERIDATKAVLKHIYDKRHAHLYDELCKQLDELAAKPRNIATPLSRSSFSGRLFTSQQTNT